MADAIDEPSSRAPRVPRGGDEDDERADGECVIPSAQVDQQVGHVLVGREVGELRVGDWSRSSVRCELVSRRLAADSGEVGVG